MRRINRISRFRDPEYWPFSQSGELVTNARELSEVYEPFEDPMIPKPPLGGQSVTTNFDSTDQQAEWAIENIGSGGSVSLSFVTDPVAGAQRGTVARVSTAGASTAIFRFYPVNNTIAGTDIRGYNNGRVRLFYRGTVNSIDKLALRFREVNKTTDYYESQVAFASSGIGHITKKVVGGISTTLGQQTTGLAGGIECDGAWRWVEWTWWQGADQYGSRLYIQIETQDRGYVVKTMSGTSNDQFQPWFVDESPSFGGSAQGGISITKTSPGSATKTLELDEITVERWV